MSKILKLSIVYEGRYPTVNVPGRKKPIKRGEEAEVLVRSGHPFADDVKIIKGKKEYDTGIKEMEKEQKRVLDEREARKNMSIEEMKKIALGNTEQGTKSSTAGKKVTKE